MGWLPMVAMAELKRSPSMCNSKVFLGLRSPGTGLLSFLSRSPCELPCTVIVSYLGGIVFALRAASDICDLRRL